MYSIDNQMVHRIIGRRRGWCFTPTDFLDIGSRQAVDTALSRLAKSGRIRRLARGLYDYPKSHTKIGLLSPSPEAVIEALTRRDRVRLQPTGAYAANLLGLSDQVPTKVVYLTNGPSRRIRIGNQEIILKTMAPRFMATAGRPSGTVIQALRHLGKAHVTMETIARLRKSFTAAEKQQILKDRGLAPAWMHRWLQAIAAEGKPCE
jgi:hypothetical protein